MERVLNIRELALRSLLTIIKDKGYSTIVVSQAIKKYKLADRDRRFYTDLVYGTLRHMMILERAMRKLSSRPIEKLDPLCRVILRMGLYQLQYMDKVPPSAACNEAVKLARSLGNEGMAKFVNAILRSALRQPQVFALPKKEDDPILYLALAYHQQEWFVRWCCERFGMKETEDLCAYFDKVPELCLRLQTNRISIVEGMQILDQAGISYRKGKVVPECVYITTSQAIESIPLLREGKALIQDEASQLVAHIVDPQPGEIIVDACAAPGGKTTHLATLGGKTAIVYGCDIYTHKLKLIEENASRLGLANIRTIQQDARQLGQQFCAKADRVLVDAPCSGLGILRHKLDLRWRKEEKDTRILPALQKQILEGASVCVKDGGLLVYSTCTMNPAENQDVVQYFLQRHPEFTLEPIALTAGLTKKGPCVEIVPPYDGMDGFFIAKLRKDKGHD